MKKYVQWAGIASWFVGLAVILMFSMGLYHKLQLANASFQQLLVERNQQLQVQQIQIEDAKKQRGMIPQEPPTEEK